MSEGAIMAIMAIMAIIKRRPRRRTRGRGLPLAAALMLMFLTAALLPCVAALSAPQLPGMSAQARHSAEQSPQHRGAPSCYDHCCELSAPGHVGSGSATALTPSPFPPSAPTRGTLFAVRQRLAPAALLAAATDHSLTYLRTLRLRI